MKFRFSLFVLFLFLILSPVALVAQQVKQTGTEETIPHKTVIIREPGSEMAAEFLSGVDILRFGVHKAGSTGDVNKIIKSLKSRDGVKKITEGPVSGDVKEFLLELTSPKDLSWYKTAFQGAGLRYIKFNSAPVRPLKDL